MDAPLTGRDATEALGLCMRLGANDARFDARKVAQAVRTSAGRRRLRGGLALARFVARARRPRHPRVALSVFGGTVCVASSADDPGRPAPSRRAV